MEIKVIDSIDGLENDLITNKIESNEILDNKGRDVKVVIIDSGVEINHRELDKNIHNYFNMINKSKDVSDYLGHGTAVTGLVSGVNTGLAPNARTIFIKSLDEKGLGTYEKVLDGITYAINIKADIMCLSLGIMGGIPKIIEDRINDAVRNGIIIVSAVGNDYGKDARYPAMLSDVIGVGGYDKTGDVAEFSNVKYDILAPSEDILTSYKDGKYAYLSGTSFATPIAVSILSCIISMYKSKGMKYNKDILIDEYKKFKFKFY